jgi:ATP-dependent DNA ligase
MRFDQNQTPVAHVICTNTKFHRNFIENIQNTGGEGVVLRKPKSIYIHGRSEELMKIKVRKKRVGEGKKKEKKLK